MINRQTARAGRRAKVHLAPRLAPLFVLLVSATAARAQPATLEASADTYLRSGSANQNQGTETLLRIQQSGNNRALLQFDSSQITAAVGSGTLVSATLELYIEHNGNNWGASGQTVSVHRLAASWSEAGATWNCPVDTNPANSQPDCSSEWSGGAFAPTATAALLHTNGLTGWVQFNVTTDVSAFLAGTANDGWIAKKTNESQNGLAEYTSRQGTAGQRPRLVLVAESPAADQVAPSVRITTPSLPAVFGDPTPQVVFQYSDNGTGVDSTTVRLFVDAADATAACVVGASSATCEAPPLTAGTHQVRAEVRDHAGNLGVASYSFDLFLGAGPHTVTVDSVADTYLKQGEPKSEPGGRVASSGPRQREQPSPGAVRPGRDRVSSRRANPRVGHARAVHRE